MRLPADELQRDTHLGNERMQCRVELLHHRPKLVPLLGGPVGAAVDGVSCKTIAGYAMRTFTPVVPRVVQAEIVRDAGPAGHVVQAEIVPD